MAKTIITAINGFGRIGRTAFRIALKSKSLKIVAINDLADTKSLAHLLKYDSIYHRFDGEVSYDEQNLIINGQKIKVCAEKDPANLPWEELGIDLVLESSGYFTDREGAAKHLQAGAKRVLISAPSKSADVPTYILGVNQEKFNSAKDSIISNSSCTTNCLAPVAKILNDAFTIERGFMTTVHSYTNDQRILDFPHKDLRRARAATLNIIPTTTGAAKSIGKVIPALEGKVDGISLRVPTPTVSTIDFICSVAKSTTTEEVNKLFKQAAQNKLKGILAVTDEPVVSTDFVGDPHSAIVDLSLTMVNDNLIKVVAWYDNEWGYAARYVEMAEYVG